MRTLKNIAIQFLNTDSVKSIDAKVLLHEAKELLQDFKFQSYNKTKKHFGFSYFAGIDSSSKIIKGNKVDYKTLVLYLLPSEQSGIDVCPFACLGCRLACLNSSGRYRLEQGAVSNGKSKYNRIEVSRLIKTWIVLFRKDIAIAMLDHEITAKKAKFEKFAVRLNGTSDLSFYDIIVKHKDVQFYDYTKDPKRFELNNYHLTFSYSTSNKARISHYKQAIERGQNIAFPVIKEDFNRILALPNTFSMDDTDLRFLDGKGYGILIAKENDNISCGIDNKFILSFDDFVNVINMIEN